MTIYDELLINEYLKKYAINWFKINEGSGTRISNSKGSSIGTINGATWVNGGGLLFDNNTEYVAFSEQTLKYGEKSIYVEFELKSLANQQTIFSNIDNTSSKNGYIIYISGGKVNLLFYRNSDAFTKWLDIADVQLNKKHRLLITFSSSLNVTFYLDDMFTPVRENLPLGFTENTYGDAGRLGRSTNVTAANALNYMGIIYNFATFDKDLSQIQLNKTLILHDGEYKKWNEKIEIKQSKNNFTSNTHANGDKVSSSTNNTSREGFRAFDGNYSTPNAWLTSPNVVYGWLLYEFNEPKLVTKYKITGSVESDYINRLPKNWTFESSEDGLNWVILDRRENEVFSAGETKTFSFNNSKKFKYYRINITSNNGRTDFLMIVEFEMWGYENEIDSSGFVTINSSTPSSQQFLEEGMDSLSPLLDRKVTTLEPQSMTDKSEILSSGETGKVFGKTINLNKYLDIRNMKVEVK